VTVRQAQILAEPIVASGHWRCEAAQIAKYEDDLVAMTFEDAFIALRDNEVGELRREPSGIGAGCGKTMPNLPRIT
jgi:hypothetical protein